MMQYIVKLNNVILEVVFSVQRIIKLTKLFLVDKNYSNFYTFTFTDAFLSAYKVDIGWHKYFLVWDTEGLELSPDDPVLTLLVIVGWEMVTCWVAADYWQLLADTGWGFSVSPESHLHRYFSVLTMIHSDNNWSLSVIQVGRPATYTPPPVLHQPNITGSKNKCKYSRNKITDYRFISHHK